MKPQWLFFASVMSALPLPANAAPIYFTPQINTVPDINRAGAVDDLTWSSFRVEQGLGDQSLDLRSVDSPSNVLLFDESLFDHDSLANEVSFAAASLDAGPAMINHPQLSGSVGARNRFPHPWRGVPPEKGHDQITSTPEPATLLLLGTGLAGLVARRRVRSQS